MKTFFYISAGLFALLNVSIAQTLNIGNNQTVTITSDSIYTGLTMGNNSNLYINPGVTLTINGNASATNGGDIYVNGTLIITGTLSAGNNLGLNINGSFQVGSVSVANNSSLTVTGNGDLQVSGSFTASNNTSIIVDLGGNVNVGGNMTIGGGTSSVTVNGTVTVGGTYTGPTPTGLGTMSDANGIILGTPLPVTLLNSNIATIDGKVVLTWRTASEKNNDRFEILRSTNLIHWNAIGSVIGSGTTQEVSAYSFVDFNPPAGQLYYRLKQIDFDGTTEIIAQHVVSVENVSEITLFPNPVTAGDAWFIKGITENDVVKIFNTAMQPVDKNNLSRGVYLVFINQQPPLKLIVK